MALAVGLVLRWGVALAGTIAVVGGVLFLRAHGGDPPRFSEFRVLPVPLSSLAGTLRAASEGDGAALIQSGLLVLIGTPVARVVMLLVGFARARQWTYVALSAVVLGALATSIAQST